LDGTAAVPTEREEEGKADGTVAAARGVFGSVSLSLFIWSVGKKYEKYIILYYVLSGTHRCQHQH
jgi:hypothetical protein